MTEEAVRVAIEEAGVAEPVFDQVRTQPNPTQHNTTQQDRTE